MLVIAFKDGIVTTEAVMAKFVLSPSYEINEAITIRGVSRFKSLNGSENKKNNYR